MQRRPHSTPANFGMASGQSEMHMLAIATPAPGVDQQFHAHASTQDKQLAPSGAQMQGISISSSENHQNTSFISQNSSSCNNLSLQNSPPSSSYSSHESTTAYSLDNSSTPTAYSLRNSTTSKAYNSDKSTPSRAFSLHNSPTSIACSSPSSSTSTSSSLQNSTPYTANSLHTSPAPPAAYNRHNSAPTLALSLHNSMSPIAINILDSSPFTSAGGVQSSSNSTPSSVYESASAASTSSIAQSTTSTSPGLARALSSPSINDLMKTSLPSGKESPQSAVEETKEENSADLAKPSMVSEYDLIEEYISQDLQRGMTDSNVDGQAQSQDKAERKLSEEFTSPSLKTVLKLEYSSYSHSIKSITDDDISRIYDECSFLPEIKNVSIELVEASKYIDTLVLLRSEHDRLRFGLTRLGDLNFVDAVLMMKEIIAQHHQLFPIISRRHDQFPTKDLPVPSPIPERVPLLKPDDCVGAVPSSLEIEIAKVGSQDQEVTPTNTSSNPQVADQEASDPHYHGDGSNNRQNVSQTDCVNAQLQISRILDQSNYHPDEGTTELQNNKTPSDEKQYNTGSASELNFNTKTSEELNYDNKTSTESNYNNESFTELNFDSDIFTERLYGKDPSGELQYNKRPPAKLNYNIKPPEEVNYNNNVSTEPHYSSGYHQATQSQKKQSYSQIKTTTLNINAPRLRLKGSPNGSMKTDNFLSSSCTQNSQDLRLKLPSVGNRQITHQGGPSHNPKRFCTMNNIPRYPIHRMSTFRYMSIPPQSPETNPQSRHSIGYNVLTSPSNTSQYTSFTSVTQDTLYGDSARQLYQHNSHEHEYANTSEKLSSPYCEQDKPRYHFPN